MKISSDNVKAVGYAVAGTLAIYLAWKIYRKVSATGKGIGQAIAEIPADLAQMAKDAVKAASDSAAKVTQGVKDSVSGAIDSATGQGVYIPDPKFVKELKSDRWDLSTRNLIGDFNEAHKRGRTDYSGWHVYDDGTVITPNGDYLKIDPISSAADTEGGYGAAPVYSPSGSLWASPYPSAKDFLSQVNPEYNLEQISTEGMMQ